MNKTFSFRFVVITFFCLLSLAIKSENSCYARVSITPKNGGSAVPVTILKIDEAESDYKPNVLFIKI